MVLRQAAIFLTETNPETSTDIFVHGLMVCFHCPTPIPMPIPRPTPMQMALIVMCRTVSTEPTPRPMHVPIPIPMATVPIFATNIGAINQLQL